MYKIADFVLIHGDGIFDKIIQAGQLLRFSKQDAFYNHAALIISEDGDLIEAVSKGVKRSHIRKYQNASFQTKIVHIVATDEDRQEAVDFALSRRKDRYGWTTIASCALCLLTGLKMSFGFSAQCICSGLVTRSLERTNFIPERDPENMMPADLAAQFLISHG